MVYSFFIILTILPGVSFGGVQVKKKCLKKDKQQVYIMQSVQDSEEIPLLVASPEKDNKQENADFMISICTLSVSFISTRSDDPVNPTDPVLKRTDRPYIYTSPDIMAVVGPPRNA